MFGDFNPLHVDEEFSKKSLFAGRILHEPFTSALVPPAVYAARLNSLANSGAEESSTVCSDGL